MPVRNQFLLAHRAVSQLEHVFFPLQTTKTTPLEIVCSDLPPSPPIPFIQIVQMKGHNIFNLISLKFH